MSHDLRDTNEVPPPPLQTIGDLTYSSGTDIPFGKQLHLGITKTLIYESAIEKGYRAGIQAHRTFLKDHDTCSPVMLDDHQFTLVIESFQPHDLTPFNEGLWRMHFIVGWTCLYLGIVIDEKEEPYA